MIVYIVINKTITQQGNDKINIVGAYDDHKLAMEQYKKYLNNGQYQIISLVINQTVMNVGI